MKAKANAHDGRWHRWFAWRPVGLRSGQLAWLCFVERAWRETYDNGYWVYR